VIAYVLYTLFVIACLILILVVLLQPGKGDAATALGGGATGAAFGPRGTTSLLAKITIGAAVTFMALAFMFQVPGFLTGRSVTSGVAPEEGTQETTPLPPPAEGGQELTLPAPAPDGTAVPAGTIQVGPDGKIQSTTPAPGQVPAEAPKQDTKAPAAGKQDSKAGKAPEPSKK